MLIYSLCVVTVMNTTTSLRQRTKEKLATLWKKGETYDR